MDSEPQGLTHFVLSNQRQICYEYEYLFFVLYVIVLVFTNEF